MLATGRRRPAPPVIREAKYPAPLGGLNTIDAASEMPASDCFALWNAIGSEYGLRSRLGWREWCTGLTGASDDRVPTLIPFTGTDASLNRLFAVTSTGIWDVSASSASPTQALAFGDTTGSAGRGYSHVFVTTAGHFCLYCDEQNGLFIYDEDTDTWNAAVGDTTQPWTASTTYIVGDLVVNDGNVYVCDTDGVSDTSGGPSGTGTDIGDGSTQWDYVGAAVANAIGPSLADQRLGYTCDPADFVFVNAFKGRPWFVERSTARAWYLDLNSIYGTATSFNFASKLRSGGYLVGLWNWTYDGGAGIDDALVGVFSGGDVAIYQGTNPNSATTFGLRGVWSIGPPPAGRDIASKVGGDLLLVSRQGAVPLSKLVVGGELELGQYATAKVSNLLNALMLTRAELPGWALRLHPEDNTIMLLVPTTDGAATEQLAMSLAKKGWARYRDLPIYSAEEWGGKLYFGTADGRVCINDGYTDGRTLDDPDSYTPVQCYMLGSFQHLGSPNQKQVQLIRPRFMADSPTPDFSAVARYDYDTAEPDVLSGGAGTGNAWDIGEWDTDVWGGDYVASSGIFGAAGMGVNVAIGIRWTATGRTVLVDIDLGLTTGGFL